MNGFKYSVAPVSRIKAQDFPRGHRRKRGYYILLTNRRFYLPYYSDITIISDDRVPFNSVVTMKR